MSGGAGRGGSLESQDSTASRSSDEPGEDALAAALAAGTAQLLDDADLPTAIHVTNLPLAVFEEETQKVGAAPGTGGCRTGAVQAHLRALIHCSGAVQPGRRTAAKLNSHRVTCLGKDRDAGEEGEGSAEPISDVSPILLSPCIETFKRD